MQQSILLRSLLSAALTISTSAAGQTVQIVFTGTTTGYSTPVPGGGAYIPNSLLTSGQNIFSISALADSSLSAFYPQTLTSSYYTLSKLSFNINGIEVFNDLSSDLKAVAYVINHDSEDMFGISLVRDTEIDATTFGPEHSEFYAAYSLSPMVFGSTKLPGNAAFALTPLYSVFGYIYGGDFSNGAVPFVETSAYANGPPLASQLILTELPGVPELSTWAMMFLGFGATGAVLRCRSKNDHDCAHHLNSLDESI